MNHPRTTDIYTLSLHDALPISDTQSTWGRADREIWFERFFNETFRTIDAKFVINTGDLVDSDYHGFLQKHTGQRAFEWQNYSLLLDRAGMNQTNYYDVAGNHDCYDDPGFTWYLDYSVQQKLYYDFTVNLDTGDGLQKYHFIGLHVPEDNGIKYPFALFGYLNETELDWYESVLEKNQDAAVTVAFGHMPAYEVSQGGSRFFQLNKKYGVDLYLTGHGHDNTYQMVDNVMPSYETGKLTDDGNFYRIVAIENNIISTSVQVKDEWPVGVITSPVDHHNVYAQFPDKQIAEVEEIHALAWDPLGVDKVEWRYTKDEDHTDSWSDWAAMTPVSGPYYLASGSRDLADDEDHLIQIKITGGSGEKIEQIEYKSERKMHWGWFYMRPLIIIGVVFIFSTPALKYIARKRGTYPPKREEELVDPKLKRLLFLKMLCIFVLPLTFAPIWADEVVAVFALFYMRASGVYWYANNMLFASPLFLFGILAAAGNLSPRKRYWMSFIVVPLNIACIGFLVYFYAFTVGWLGLLAPGFYAIIGCELLIFRRERELMKSRKPNA